ncbi:MAG: hypothetical protein JW953_16190 [Anaerolineae bacterium]|nr:hypothetical protein [Anaerolineae bacterium]
MKHLVILITLLALLVQPALGLIPVAQAQGPIGEGEPEPGGMPGYPTPAKPIPHHEPGHLSRAGSYRTQVVRENELGAQELVEISGVDAMAADGLDPLAGNYGLVNRDQVLFSSYDNFSSFALQTFNYISPTLSVIPGSQTSIGNFPANDITAGDLNGDGQAEQIAAWIGADNYVYLSVGELNGSLGKSTSAPAAVARSSGQIDLVVRGYDQALWYCSYDIAGGNCLDWSNAAGGLLASGPAITSRGPDELDVFAIGTDNEIYRVHWASGLWGDWQQVNGGGSGPMPQRLVPMPELPAPAVVARGAGLDLFRVGPDNTLRWLHSDDGSTWEEAVNLGGMLASGAGVVSWDANHMQVFARGVDEALWYLTYDGHWDMGPDGSYQWQRVSLAGMDEGVTITSAPTAVSPAPGQIVVYARGSDQQLWQIEYSGGSWGSWSSGGGPIASGMGGAVSSGHTDLFAQKADGSLQTKSNGTGWTDLGGLTACCFEYRTDFQTTITIDPTWNVNLMVDVETGHFSGDGREQIVLAYQHSNLFEIFVYDTLYGFQPIRVGRTGAIVGNHFRITIGDFDKEQAGDEIGVVYLPDQYRYGVNVYAVTPGEPWVITWTDSTDGFIYPGESGLEFASTLNIASGDFDGDAEDEIVTYSDWVRPCSGGLEYEVHAYLLDREVSSRRGWFYELGGCTWFGTVTEKDLTGIALAAGDVDGDGVDELVFTLPRALGQDIEPGLRWPSMERNLYVAEYNSSSSPKPFPTPAGVYAIPSYRDRTFLDRLAVGDLDRDMKEEIVFYDSESEAYWGGTLRVIEFDPATGLRVVGWGTVSPFSPSVRSPNLTTGAVTGESIRVGPPSYRVQNRVDTLVALLNMPPKHRDLVKDAEGNYQLIESPEGECNPSPDSPDCTHAKYAALDFTSSEQTIQTVHAYEISAGMEAEACAGGGVAGIAEVKACARTSINATHGGNFEKSTEAIQSIGFRRKVIAANDDKVVYFGTPYGVWEYPVLSGSAGEPSEDVFITVAFPLISVTQYPDTSGGYYSGTCDETWYAAGHQPNNVWSYDPIGDVTFADYDPGYELTYDAIEGDWAEGEITYEKLQSAFSSVSFQHSISARAEVEVSGEAQLKVVNVSGSFKAHVQGDYSNTHLETDRLTTSQDTTFSYFFAPQPDSSKFTTRVLFYRARDNYQVLNYQAEPGRAASWRLYNKPDPAFILPWYGFPNPANPQVPPCGEDQKLFSPNIVISPSHANLGETVTISATIRNFSGEPARNVDVRFYQGDPVNNIVIGQRTIPLLSRESGPKEVSLTWAAAGVGQQKIYAVIDPFDTIPEMHDEADLINNNLAYGLVQLAATNFADMSLVAEQPPYDAIAYALGDPRPTVSLYVPRASLDAVARFEVGSTEIELPVEGRVFEVAAYQGSKYKLWSDPIANFNLKPGAGDPPAVIIIAYTQADISALDENSLKLYRLVGTNWTEATCPGYQIYRFPEENLIAVPICQTGVFAFSDKTPPSPVGETGPVYLPLIIKDSE